MPLIINADDLGYSSHRDAGIFECFAKGCISAASLMVTGPTAESAAAKALDVGLFVGLHLNLTEGVPLSDVPLLTRLDGQMYYKDSFLALSAPRLCPEQVVRETRAQIERFKVLTGYWPVHVDGHQHVHIFPGMAELLAPIFRGYGVVSTRIPDEDLSTRTWMNAARRKKYERLFSTMVRARLSYKKCGICAPDCFIGLALGGLAMSQECLDKCLEGTFGTIEWMVHPGFVGVGPDLFDASPDRLHECEQLQKLVVPLSSPWSEFH